MAHLWAFAAVAAILTITPGPDTAMVLRQTLAAGRPAGLGTALGVAAGIIGWGLLTAAGLAAVLTSSATVYTALRWVCGVYLILLAIRAWQTPAADRQPTTPPEQPSSRPGSRAFFAGIRSGGVTALLNPKLGVFFVALVPEFIPAGISVPLGTLVLAAVQAVIAVTWYSSLTFMIVRGRAILNRTRVRTVLSRLTAFVFASFGVRVVAADA